MKTTVLYDTKTGHTQRLAQAIAQDFGVTAVQFQPGMEPVATDFLLIGSGIYKGNFRDEFLSYLKALTKEHVKTAAVFFTSMSGELPSLPLIETLKSNGIQTKREYYACKGKFLIFSRKHPNDADIQGAVDFARQTQNWAKVLLEEEKRA